MNNQEIYRRPNFSDLAEILFIAEIDSKIPLEYDPYYVWKEEAIKDRFEFFNQVKPEDFFELVELEGKIVGFHLVKKIPYPPDIQIGNIITLWCHPDHRGRGYASKLKSRAEDWARREKLSFLQTNVHKNNQRMLAINTANGYEQAYVNLRKRL